MLSGFSFSCWAWVPFWFSRAVNAASRAVSELLEKIRHFKVALKSVTADTQSLRAEIRAAEKDLRVEKIEENLLTLSTR